MTKCLAETVENTNQTPSLHDGQPRCLEVGVGHFFVLFCCFVLVCVCVCHSVEETLLQSAKDF